jgi:hypothetical protein
MTHDPYEPNFRRDPNLYVNEPSSSVGALVFILVILALLGGGSYFMNRNDDDKSANNSPRPAITSPAAPINPAETTGTAPAR